MSNIEEDVIDVIAFLAFHQSISNSFQKEKQTNCNKQITTNLQQSIYNKKKCNIDSILFINTWWFRGRFLPWQNGEKIWYTCIGKWMSILE